jgi:hypothetical protein
MDYFHHTSAFLLVLHHRNQREKQDEKEQTSEVKIIVIETVAEVRCKEVKSSALWL